MKFDNRSIGSPHAPMLRYQLHTTSRATIRSSNKCTASRRFPQMVNRYEAQGSWVNCAKLASDVEGEDLAAEGSMNRLAQICHFTLNQISQHPLFRLFCHFASLVFLEFCGLIFAHSRRLTLLFNFFLRQCMSKMPEKSRRNNDAANRIPPVANGCVAYRFERRDHQFAETVSLHQFYVIFQTTKIEDIQRFFQIEVADSGVARSHFK